MSATLLERPVTAPADGGAPARRAMRRWGWRLFRREWRQQVLVLALLMVAVAGTVVGLGVASNSGQPNQSSVFGSANTIIQLPGSDPNPSGDIAAIGTRFGAVDVIAHQNVPIPGSVSSIDLRAQNPNGRYGHVTLRLDSGRWPTAGEVAFTKDVSDLLGLHVGDMWTAGGRTLRVVGVVENPLNLSDEFALVSPGQINSPDRVSVLLNANPAALQSLHLPSGTGINVMARGTASKTAAEVLVLVLGTLGLLFVGLMAVAGFTVMAHRRLRSLGMLGALGATDRNLRLVMLANGAAVGVSAAAIGTIVGLVAWVALAPTLESVTGHRIDRYALPWWAIGTSMILTALTAVAAAWWPARAVSRTSVMAALSGRPPRPQPAHRFAALGGALLATGLVLLAFADQRRTAFIIFGTLAAAVGLLLLSPLAIRVLATAGRHAKISVRLALRDLSRYQARSGAALGAVTLATGIAATITIGATAAQNPTGPGNLPSNQMMLYFTPGGVGDPVPPLRADQLRTLTTAVNQVAASIGASRVVPVEQAYDPQGTTLSPAAGDTGGPQQAGYPTASLAHVTETARGQDDVTTVFPLYIATPAVLSLYGIRENQVNPHSDVLSSRSDLAGLQIFAPVFGFATPGTCKICATPQGPDKSPRLARPTVETFKQLPQYGSDPGTLVTPRAVQALGLRPLPSGWLLQADHPLSTTQISTARQTAASVGLYIETRHAKKSLAPLRNWSTAAGILLALGVLGLTVGLIRSETANDLRTLAATGASSNTRRNLTATTAGGLALLGGFLGTAGAYGALLLWYRSDLHRLSQVPVTNLVVILVGLPLIAVAGGWLLAGREPAALSRRPLE